eukprot:TRINITY_DN13385_c0_g2_i2.p1 TRINITY_DN13385_c0_g2~~TRINITY_DN13385_c0_g2_i2.p1  ORF type:complete len:126 (-),score=13.27 TRINITY_DN13385_c0_g2_i2:675-1052(-)
MSTKINTNNSPLEHCEAMNGVYKKLEQNFTFDNNEFTVFSCSNNLYKPVTAAKDKANMPEHISDIKSAKAGRAKEFSVCSIGDVSVVFNRNALLQTISKDVARIKEFMDNFHPPKETKTRSVIVS